MKIFFKVLVAAALLFAAFLFIRGIHRDIADVGASVASTTAIGKVSAVIGNATIARKDKRIFAEVGMTIYPDDVIETTSAGAVSILFTDESSFAVGESARLSVRQFIYDKQGHSGKSAFSLAQGVFVYTSGLIGKNDPADVSIDTPSASIGIRGTVVAGNIRPSGQDSRITVVDGGIVLTNGGGSLDMSGSLQTAVLTGHDEMPSPSESGQISPQEFASTYQAVSSVAPNTFRAVSGGGDFYDLRAHYTLTAVLNGQEFTESSLGNSGGSAVKPVLISGEAPLQMKVELHDPSGTVTDVTRDERTLYSVLKGGWLSVSPKGLVTVLDDPLPGSESLGRDEEMTILVLYGDVQKDGSVTAETALATVVVRLKIQ